MGCNSNGLNSDKLVVFVVADFVSHVIDSGSLEVDKSTGSVFFRVEHLFGFSDAIFLSYIDAPLGHGFVHFTQSDAPQLDETSLEEVVLLLTISCYLQ